MPRPMSDPAARVRTLCASLLLVGASATPLVAQAAAMGQDIVISQIVSRANVDGVYSVSVTSPASSEVVEVNEVAIVGTITVNVTGENEG